MCVCVCVCVCARARVYVGVEGSRLYTSAAYDEKMIDDALTRFDRVFEKVALKED